MANSRDLVRSDTLFSPPLAPRFGTCGCAQFPGELPHLDCSKPRFETLVAALQAGAVNGLLQRVAGEHAEHDRYARIHLRELQSARGLRTDIIIVRRLSAKYAPNRDQGVVAPRARHFLRCQRQFERAGHMHHVYVAVLRPASFQRIQRRLEQALRYKTVKPAHHNSQAQTRRVQASVDFVGFSFLAHRHNQFPLNCAARFSKKAFVPSRMSAVAQHSPKSVASRKSPSSSGISTPPWIASIQYFTARGAFSMIFFAMASAAGRSSAGSCT